MCKDNRGRNSKTQQITTIGRTNANTTEIQKTTEVSKRSYNTTPARYKY